MQTANTNTKASTPRALTSAFLCKNQKNKAKLGNAPKLAIASMAGSFLGLLKTVVHSEPAK